MEQIFDKPNGSFNIITVGRLEKEKGIDKLLAIANKLRGMNLIFKWYFIGDGVLAKWCKEYVADNKLENNVVLMGQKGNPYPYIYDSDLLVSGSLSETFGLSILEALTLETPVVSYKFEAVSELLNDTNGIVCPSFDEMERVIARLIRDHSAYEVLKNKTRVIADYNLLSSDQFQNLINNA